MIQTEILNNLLYVLYAWLAFALCVIANVVSKTYFNTKKIKQNFDPNKLFDGFLKMLCIGFSTALLAIVASALPYIPIVGNIIDAEHKDIVSIAVIYALYAFLIVKYFVEAHKTNLDIANRNILEDVNIESEDKK